MGNILRGVDISHYQSSFNSFSNIDFAIMKATEGTGYVDPYCDRLYQKAKAAGKLVGVYHFARPDLGTTPEAEAEFFINNIKGYINDAILVLDWEPNGSSIGNVAWAKRWLDRVQELTGVKAIIYMSQSPVNSYDWSPVANADYGLWVAKYGSNNGQEGQAPSVKWWSFYIMWQYTSRGRIAGYDGDLDLDNFYGSVEAWHKYANSKGSPAPTPTPAPSRKSNEEIADEVIAGKWGNGEERKRRLAEAGYDYQTVQNIVNDKLGIGKQSYYPIPSYNGVSIVDALNSIGVDTSFSNRKSIASKNGISNYTGTPAQNTRMLNLLKSGSLKK